MDTKHLKTLISHIEALKTADKSEEYNAGVSAAQSLITTVLQEAADRERIQKLEAELTELRAKYPSVDQAAPTKRGRKPKDTNKPTEASLIEEKQAQPS